MGDCEITMKYLGGMDQAPTPLMFLCRRAVKSAVGTDGIEKGDLDKLNMPNIVRKYLD